MFNYYLLVHASNYLLLVVFTCCRSFYMIKRSCLKMVTDGRLKLLRTWDLKAFTAEFYHVIIARCFFGLIGQWWIKWPLNGFKELYAFTTVTWVFSCQCFCIVKYAILFLRFFSLKSWNKYGNNWILNKLATCRLVLLA